VVDFIQARDILWEDNPKEGRIMRLMFPNDLHLRLYLHDLTYLHEIVLKENRPALWNDQNGVIWAVSRSEDNGVPYWEFDNLVEGTLHVFRPVMDEFEEAMTSMFSWREKRNKA
jgi:hypothetical protein